MCLPCGCQDEEEIVLPTDPATGKVDYIEFDSPIELVQAVLYRSGEHGMTLDKLCAVSCRQTLYKSVGSTIIKKRGKEATKSSLEEQI